MTAPRLDDPDGRRGYRAVLVTHTTGPQTSSLAYLQVSEVSRPGQR